MRASTTDSRAAAKNLLSVEVNGEARGFEGPISVASLLEDLDLGGKRVAVAVNRMVVVRSKYAVTELSDGDRIEILEAVGGG